MSTLLSIWLSRAIFGTNEWMLDLLQFVDPVLYNPLEWIHCARQEQQGSCLFILPVSNVQTLSPSLSLHLSHSRSSPCPLRWITFWSIYRPHHTFCVSALIVAALHMIERSRQHREYTIYSTHFPFILHRAYEECVVYECESSHHIKVIINNKNKKQRRNKYIRIYSIRRIIL